LGVCDIIEWNELVNLNNELTRNMFKKLSIAQPIFWLLALFLISILSMAFYWFEYRPSLIRIECENFAGSKGGSYENKEKLYKFCLNSKGLEK